MLIYAGEDLTADTVDPQPLREILQEFRGFLIPTEESKLLLSSCDAAINIRDLIHG